jgi:histone-binding protein RBBP4
MSAPSASSPLGKRKLEENSVDQGDAKAIAIDDSEEVDDRFTKDYQIWKKNTPLLYDTVFTNSLAWPSLTVQWCGASVSAEGSETVTHKMILGTHTSGEEPNTLLIAQLLLPKDRKTVIEDMAGSSSSAPVFGEEAMPKEVGGYAGGKSSFQIQAKIIHEGEVNVARHMPQEDLVVATKPASPDVLVFDVTKHPSNPEPGSKCNPQHRCKGHTSEGFGLSWSSLNKGHLISGSNDGLICHWDITGGETTVEALNICVEADDAGAVTAVDWHPTHPSLFLSCGDSGAVKLWDVRSLNDGASKSATAHDGEASTVQCCPFSDYIFASGGSDKLVKLWDWRQMNEPLYTLPGHEDGVMHVRWCPQQHTILASSSGKSIHVWDMRQFCNGQDDESSSASVKPMFIHAGHTSCIEDFSWSTSDPWTIASTAQDNTLQVWQVAERFRVPVALADFQTMV